MKIIDAAAKKYPIDWMQNSIPLSILTVVESCRDLEGLIYQKWVLGVESGSDIISLRRLKHWRNQFLRVVN
jgi:hypothetical protein